MPVVISVWFLSMLASVPENVMAERKIGGRWKLHRAKCIALVVQFFAQTAASPTSTMAVFPMYDAQLHGPRYVPAMRDSPCEVGWSKKSSAEKQYEHTNHVDFRIWMSLNNVSRCIGFLYGFCGFEIGAGVHVYL